ncbi:MAG: hypothetical protein IJ744_12065 [Lachnospiraceae bacterium]|nr:hypothetical protein [Lachnospiraceae bacterium]
MNNVLSYVIWFAVSFGLFLLSIFANPDNNDAQASNNDITVSGVTSLVMILASSYYWMAKFYCNITFESLILVELPSVFATKGGEFPTLANISEWNFLTKYVAFCFVLCLIIYIVDTIRSSKHWFLDILGEAGFISLVLLVLQLLLLLRAWIGEHFMFLNAILGLLEIVVWAVGAVALFAPFYAIYGTFLKASESSKITTSSSGKGSSGTDLSDIIEPVHHAEPDDLPVYLQSGTITYERIESYGYGVMYRNTTDPSDEITITVIYSMTDSEASTNAGHFYF